MNTLSDRNSQVRRREKLLRLLETTAESSVQRRYYSRTRAKGHLKGENNSSNTGWQRKRRHKKSPEKQSNSRFSRNSTQTVAAFSQSKRKE